MNNTNGMFKDKIKVALEQIEELRLICAKLEATVSVSNVQFLEKTNEIAKHFTGFTSLNDELMQLKDTLNKELDVLKMLQEKGEQFDQHFNAIEKHLAFLEKVRLRIKNDGIKITVTLIILVLILMVHMIFG